MEKLLNYLRYHLFLGIFTYNFGDLQMDIEKILIISILKLTKDGAISNEIVKKDVRMPLNIVEKLLKKLHNEGFIYLRKNFVEVDGSQRFKLAVRALQLGADPESVSSFLCWREFEDMAAFALERNGYAVKKNLWFKYAGKRWEIDVVGCKKPIALCIDCKHWHYGMYPSKLKRAVNNHLKRTSAFAEALPGLAGKIECASWDRVKLVPAVLSLFTGRFKFHENVPVIPVLQLQDFLSQLPAYANMLALKNKTV
jgi:Holliday junction resolvase-like predicted endonuclease